MAFNVDVFRGEILTGGILQTNKFEVRLNCPVTLIGKSGSNQSLMFRAESVKMPGVNINTTNVNRYGIGPNQKLPFNVSFADNSISFIEDKNGTVWKTFYSWMNMIFDYSGLTSSQRLNSMPSYLVEYKRNYMTDIHVYVYDTQSRQPGVNDKTSSIPVSVIIMKEAYPISLNDVNLSWSQSNLMKVDVGFTFREWHMQNFDLSKINQAVVPPTATSPIITNEVGPPETYGPNTPRQETMNPRNPNIQRNPYIDPNARVPRGFSPPR